MACGAVPDCFAEVITRDYLGAMRVVGIKELKTKLSEYLRMVRHGEVFLVTDRDEVVAELRPAGPLAVQPESAPDALLERMIASGDVAPPRLSAEDWSWRPRPLGLADGTAAELLNELRSERAPDGE